MCEKYREVSADDRKDFQDIVELITTITVDEVWGLYYCASGLVRCEIESAIRQLIQQGNHTLSAQFPEWAS